MQEQADSFEIDGVWLRPSGAEPAAFEYLAGAPAPERDPLGRPTLLLLASDQGARLQLGTRWGLDAGQTARLVDAIAERFPALDPAMITLHPALASIAQVELVLGDGQGAYELLKTSPSSGFAPFAAIFAVSLSGDQKGRALAALNGRLGFLSVIYRGARAAAVAITATIAGDVQDDLAALGRAPTLAECAAQVALALEQGRLTLVLSDTEAPADFQERAAAMARSKAARVMLRMAGDAAPPGWSRQVSATAALSATARLEDSVQLPFERTADIGAWFADGSGADHIKVVGAALPDPAPASAGGAGVALDFDPRGAPIAFVELACGAARATLRGPVFAAATLPAGAQGPLSVTTHYSAAGAPYLATLEPAGAAGWALAPADLGLARVAIDGARLQAAGAREARVRARYLPDGAGLDDDRTVYLRGAEWAASWYVITRAAGLGGTLELECKETAADGTPTMHPREQFSQSEITL